MLTQIEIEKSQELNDINCSTIAIETKIELSYIERLRQRELKQIEVSNMLKETENLIL